MEKSSYLFERHYTNQQPSNLNKAKYEYWENMLGKDAMKRLMECKNNYRDYLSDDPYTINNGDETDKYNKILTTSINQMKTVNIEKIKSPIFFAEFYVGILDSSLKRLKKALEGSEGCFEQSIYDDFAFHLASQLQNICLRSLIAELNAYKTKKMLKGQDAKEEYRYFCEEIIGKPGFKKRLFEKYPVLCRCIGERMEYLEAYYVEIINYFEKDRAQMLSIIGSNSKVCKIAHMTGGIADVHNQGRQVIRIQLDNGKEILYKPRSMENEQKYMRMLRWLSKKTGVSQYEYDFRSFSDHSWCSIVEYKSCNSQEELREYYKRLGVQLFLTYFLSTKDLHYENIIACGEYPVLIDLETMVTTTYSHKRETADEEIYYRLSHSVLATGLLPYSHWNRGGKGIDSSGIGGNEGQTYPFKVPTVINPKTSQMHIEYRHPQTQKAQNLATMNGNFESPVRYEEEILSGFTQAYRAVLDCKEEFKMRLRDLEDTKIRFLAADTQRYSMLLSSSYHPSLLKDGADREIFLYSLWRGRDDEDKELVEKEVRSLLKGDIPYFERCLYEKDMEELYKRLDCIDSNNLEQQRDLIQVALELTPENKDQYINSVYRVEECSQIGWEVEIIQKEIKRLTDRLIRDAVWNQAGTEVSWYVGQFMSKTGMRWNIKPMNMYLYDGLAGMLLLMYQLQQFDRQEEVKRMYQVLKKMLFDYTDRGTGSIENLESMNTGAYEGEASIVYVYLMLYQQSWKNEYLDYAKKHAVILRQLLEKDEHYDLLSGNAGAAWILLKLYDTAGDNKYLEMAERAVGVLIEKDELQERGIGWRIEEGTAPMAGIAHGNSGILMPIIILWARTKKEKYRELAEEVWKYEESLYDARINNWLDIRTNEISVDEAGAVAWCHGAGGILLSRLVCYKEVGDICWKSRFKTDIARAYAKMKNYWKRDSWCLCHGICGNMWILEEAERFYGEVEGEGKRLPGDSVRLLPQEIVNPGLMNGYGGILGYLINVIFALFNEEKI